MKKIAVIYLGHSHLAAMIPYLFYRSVETGDDNVIEHYVFDTNAYNIFAMDESKFQYSVDVDGKPVLNPQVVEMVEKRISPDRERHYISMFGGNSHNALMLLQPERRFDFVFPPDPEIQFSDTAEIIPFSAIKETIRVNAQGFLHDLAAIKNTFGANVYHLQSPPPMADDDYVKSVVDKDDYFRNMPHKNLTPSWTRYKAWATHSHIFAEYCAEADICFLPVPSEAIDDGRWLNREYAAQDPTHGNVEYGGCVLRSIEARFGGHFGGWDWLK